MDCTFSPEKDFQKLEQAVAALCGADKLPVQMERYQRILKGLTVTALPYSPRRAARRSAATIPTTSMAGCWPAV